MKVEWRKLQSVSDLIDDIHGLVKLQVKDLRRVLHGDQNFMLTGLFVAIISCGKPSLLLNNLHGTRVSCQTPAADSH